ncbi:ABC transporter permease [Paractinoplanes rishiriensis]|uniref:Uncharacterized protein n=1 Tax=Paractinoplanes rishiriensis TaxID=1050105 RepID=A0A919JWY8_9ACTN|nr:ABC transporter permease [Actinoplanes rishiriensis]GIE94997.1 hypothetical protein Ari01nite_24620 [Actinoplanes rishiriensis]
MIRLIAVELRKLADTRAGFWLLLITGLGTAGTSAIMLGWAPDNELTFAGFFAFGLVPPTFLLPVVGILSMTGEWSQRTALTTFTLVPARGRVMAAKLAAGVLVAIATVAATALLAAAATLLGGTGVWTIAGSLLWQALLLQILFVLMGMGFGALLMNSPLAISAFFLLPTIWAVLSESIRQLARAAEWLSLTLTTEALSEPSMTSGEYARLAAAAGVWIALPIVLGWWRVVRREVS